jgi:ADP-heptose:LPS heptosyltransferase
MGWWVRVGGGVEPGADGRSAPDLTAVRRVAIFAQLARTGVGDYVMRNGFFQLIRRAFPRAAITLIVGANDAADFDDFLTNHALVDDVLVCPSCEAGPPSAEVAEWQAFLVALRARRFEACVVDVGTLSLHAELAREVGIPIRVGIERGHPEEPALTAAAPIVARNGDQPDLADYMAAYAAALGIEAPPPDAVVPPFPYRATGDPPASAGTRIALHIGGGAYWNRRWPLDNYVELVNRLLHVRDCSVVLVGTQEHQEHTELLARIDPDVRDRITEIGDVALARTATVLAGCDLFLGSDSGPMHVAVAMSLPTITLYGPADSEFLWDRVYQRHYPISRHWPCQQIWHDWTAHSHAPCAHSCRYEVLADGADYPRCVADITVDEVLAKTLEVLDLLPERRSGLLPSGT